MSRRPLRLGGFIAALLGALLLVLGFTSGRGGAFDEASRLSGDAGPQLVVESIDLTTDLRAGTVTDRNTVDPPEGVALWLQGFDRVRPGTTGTSVVAGHVVYDGQDDIFTRLPEVEVGEHVRLVQDGETLDLVVTRAEVVDKRDLTRDEQVWGANSDTRRVVLITCDDELGIGTDGHTKANFVVVAEPA